MPQHNRIQFSVLLLLFLAGCVLSLLYGGSEKISISDLSSDQFIFWQIRVPKTITAVLAGCTLSVSGLLLQIIFRNPLAGPYVLGISSGASLMVAVSLMAGPLFGGLFMGKSMLLLSAITGSLLITFVVLAISEKVSSNVILLLIGLMLSQICSALQMALEYFSDPNNLKSFVIWGMGSLANTTNADLGIYVPATLMAVFAVLFFIKPLNAMLLGEDYARNVGIDFKRSRFYLILLSSCLTGITTAFCGPVAFVGIAVPILSRLIFKSSRQQVHFFSCLLIGSIILLFADAITNSLIKSVSLPINMITTFIGAPLVIYLMFKNKQW